MSPNAEKENGRNIEEYMFITVKLVDSLADGGKTPNHGQARYLSRPYLTDPSHLVSQARDGYIAARVAELENGFRWTGHLMSPTWIPSSISRFASATRFVREICSTLEFIRSGA